MSGTINWLTSKYRNRKSPCFIVLFDLGNKSYHSILLPDYGEVDVNYSTLVVLRDCLCILLPELWKQRVMD